jgi:serine/threonine protein kinase/tetratricopeptide (TPR) repeat protein
MAVWNPKANDVFLKALETRSLAERQAYLDEACAGDAGLRRQVESLLEASERAGSFLEFPGPATDTEPIHEGPGTVIGPYKLLEQIGEGGFGVVFMAEQIEPVQRKVALKIIKPGMDSRQVIARFEQERQALALMDHPNIAKVFDAGTVGTGTIDAEPEASARGVGATFAYASGSARPYFVMELVKGVPITRFCDDYNLTPRERLELFLPVCHAAQHAHQKGIIHRDLKPSNVLVALYDDKPVPKIIDFGVAKATGPRLTERTMFTQFGQLVGTLEYMSPEQASFNALDIDTRSDIYALGVLLYELLTGSTPFERKRLHQAAFDEVLRIIREEEPPKPSTRLSTAEELPAIAAHRKTEAARLGRLVKGDLDWIVMRALEKDRARRYETANALASDIENYLHDEPVQASPPSTGYRLRKFVRRNRRALTTLALLGVMLLVALGAVAGSIGWVVRDRDARRARSLADAQSALDRAEFLQDQGKRAEALAAFERAELIAGDLAENRDLAQRLAALRERFEADARDQEFAARFEEIRLQEQTRVNEAASTFTPESAFPKLRDALLRVGIELGATAPAQVVARIHDRPEAIQRQVLAALHECLTQAPKADSAIAQSLIAVLNAADADSWRVQVRKAWGADDQETLARLARDVDVQTQMPNFLLWTARLLTRTGSATRLDLLRRIQRAYPGDFWANESLAWNLYRRGMKTESIRYYTAALGARPHNPGVLLNRGNALSDIGELDAAIVDFREAIAYAPRYAVAHNSLGMALARKEDWKGAHAAYQQALAIDPNLALAYGNIGALHLHRHELKEAIAACRRAIALNPNFADAHYNLGYALAVTGDHEQAIEEYRLAIAQAPALAEAHFGLGVSLNNQGKTPEAIVALKKAIAANPSHGPAHHILGALLQFGDRWEEAIAAYKAAVRSNPNAVGYHIELSWALVACPEPKLRDPQRALEEANQVLRLGHAGTGWSLRGCAQYRLGYWRDSVEALERALPLGSTMQRQFQFLFLAMAHERVGNPAEARKRYQQALQEVKTGPRTALDRQLQHEAAALLKLEDGSKPEAK